MSYKQVFLATAATALIFVSAACAPVKANRGNYLRDEKVHQVELNKTTKEQITRKFGPPTTVASFDDNTWYYIGERTETMGMFETEVKERRIFMVQFDEEGVLENISEMDPKAAQEVKIVDRTTNTAGKEFTILQQLVGNVGRFNPATEQARSAGGNN